jgi:MFS family permease
LEDQPVSDPDRGADRPATFREVLASGEFRAIFFSSTLSTVGDSMARAAVTALVYQRTHSVLASGATFAISYVPWIGFGTLLAALAERYPYRRTMIVCDVARMVTIGLVVLPGVPLSVLLGLLFLTALFDPPFRAARSALNARVLSGDRYVLGLSMLETAVQVSIITGYFLGGTIAAYNARMAVLFDAATFGISACIIGLWVHHREPALRPERRTHLLRETAEGFRVVFGRPVLRAIAIVVFSGLLFAVVPEGLGAAWAGWLTGNTDSRDSGWMQGLIMCSMPTGFIFGSILINRFVPPLIRQRLIRPFAVLAPLALVFALFNPSVYGVALISASSGFAVAALLPAANGLFVQALPNEVRARAFGVMQSGVLLFQGVAVFGTGALASRISLPLVVGTWGAGGVVLMIVAALTWPRRETVAGEIERARRINEDTDDSGPDQPGTQPPADASGTPPSERPSDRPSDDDRRSNGGGRHRLRAASR